MNGFGRTAPHCITEKLATGSGGAMMTVVGSTGMTGANENTGSAVTIGKIWATAAV